MADVTTPPPPPPAELLRQLDSRIEPVPIAPLYRVGLILVAVVMILLPLVYIALIGVAAYFVYWHATHNTSIFETTGRGRGAGRGALLMYAGPLVIGAILVLFMIKPLFARRGKAPNLMTLKREQEPLLFSFVERLCDLVGSPRPRKINVDCQVNASASFGGGLFSLFGSNLVLT